MEMSFLSSRAEKGDVPEGRRSSSSRRRRNSARSPVFGPGASSRASGKGL